MIILSALGIAFCMWAMIVVHSREVINGNGLVEHYLIRHTLLRVPGLCAVYWHNFTHDDWSIDLHDHPKSFISIGVRGGYIEQTWEVLKSGHMLAHYQHFNAPWIRWFPPNHVHRLMMLPPPSMRREGEKPRPCWTIVIVGPIRQNWGYWIDMDEAAQHVDWMKPISDGDDMSRRSRVGPRGKMQIWLPWAAYVYSALRTARRSR